MRTSDGRHSLAAARATITASLAPSAPNAREPDLVAALPARTGGPPLRRLLVPLLAGVLTLLAPAATAGAASTRPLSVTITHVECIDDCDATGLEAALEGHADFYAKVFINGTEQPRTPRVDDNQSIDPFWVVSAEVPDTVENIPVSIQIWDFDSTSGDDQGDVSPRDGDDTLDFRVTYLDGKWLDPTGSEDNVNWPQSCSTGDGGPNDGPRVRVCFDISKGDGDVDDDGIPDGVERFGVRDPEGNLVADMAAMGADPCRKTIAMEIDWMGGAADGHTHRPTDAAVNDAVAAMNAAPVPATTPCPYGGFPQRSSGVNLVLDRSNQIPEQAVFPLGSLAAVRDGGNFDPARRPYFHYVLFVHDQKKGDSSSGQCCVDNRDFIVSLGSWANQVGTFRDQAGTILHEGGHALGLGHGGADGVNFKPNYLSVMNYSFDPTGIPDPTISPNIDTDGNGTADQSYRLDYSRSKLASLNEGVLNESAGIGDGTDLTLWSDPTYALQSAAGNGAIDWDQKPGSSPVDLNRQFCVGGGANGTLDTSPAGDDTVTNAVIAAGADFVCNTTAAGDDDQNTTVGTNVMETLTGFDDWQNLQFRAAMSVTAAGSAVEHGEDMTFEQTEAIEHQTFALFSPDLTVTKTVDHGDANPGDRLTYAVTARNVGTGAAQGVKVTDTLPDGSTDTRAPVGTFASGGSRLETFTYLVPCTTADRANLVNSATVSGANLLNDPEVDTSNNTATASTTVHAPVMTLAKTATPSVNAGEAVTYRLTYENTGSGEARSVVIADTLPADVYYSTALDLGAGPAPTSVTRHPDGTTTLTWNVASVAGGSGSKTIEYTARPSLLLLGGSVVTNAAKLMFTNANDCTFAPVTTSSPTGITSVAPTGNPLSMGYWRTHPEEWTAEMLARIQATDQRFDGADGSSSDGRLSATEVAAVLAPGGASPSVLRAQLLATYFNLATRRINAATVINSKTDARLGLHSVREAALFSSATLALPLPGTRISDALGVLDEINNNRSEVF